MHVDTHSKVSAAGRKLGSANYLNERQLAQACVANEVIARISLRWKMSVLYAISDGTRTFAALKRRYLGVSDHILAARLRELQREGLIAKHQQEGRRPAYSATDRGSSLLKIVDALCAWGTGSSVS